MAMGEYHFYFAYILTYTLHPSEGTRVVSRLGPSIIVLVNYEALRANTTYIFFYSYTNKEYLCIFGGGCSDGE